MSDYFPSIWLFGTITYTLIRLVKMYPHVKEEGKVLFFLNLWMVMPEILDDEGKEIRKELLVLIPVFAVSSIIFVKAWN